MMRKNIILPGLFIFILFISSPVIALVNLSDIISSEDADKAIHEISRKIEKSPEQAELYVSRGDIYFLIHEFDSAEEDYSKAIALNNKLDAAYYGRGMTLGRQGLVQEGIDISGWETKKMLSKI